MLPARELVRPNMRRSVAFPAPQALVGIDMQRIFAFFAAQMAARSENPSSEKWSGARGQRRQLQARASARSDNVPPTRQVGLLTLLLPNVPSRCVMGLRLAAPLFGQ